MFLLNIRLHTWEPVSILSRRVWSRVFQNLMVLSAVPPPVASTPWLWGDHDMPFTAATWLLNLQIGVEEWLDQMNNLLSLPPDASRLLSKDHFSPQTYCECPSYLLVILLKRYRVSLRWMLRSLEPEASSESPQAKELTLAV